MLHRVVLLISLCVCTVYGDFLCCSPPQWEATEGLMAGSVDDEGNTAVVLGTVAVSFDATGKRVHLVENIQNGDQQQQFTVLQLYNQNVQFTIKNGTCTRSTAPAWADANCIPGNATFVSKYRLGLKENIETSLYTWTDGAAQVATQVTADCVPVTSESTGTLQGVSYISGTSFLGVTVGIKDPSIFDIPPSCKQGNVPELTNPVRLFRRSTM